MAFRSRRGSFARTLKSSDNDMVYLPDMFDGGVTAQARNQWYFEIAWEVANKGEKSVIYFELFTLLADIVIWCYIFLFQLD